MKYFIFLLQITNKKRSNVQFTKFLKSQKNILTTTHKAKVSFLRSVFWPCSFPTGELCR
jgi:hypothetical protein